MSDAKWIKQLQAVLDCPVREHQLPIQDWRLLSGEQGKQPYDRLQKSKTNAVTIGDYVNGPEGVVWFALEQEGERLQVLEVIRKGIQDTELRLIGWAICQSLGDKSKSLDGFSESERYVRELGSWIDEQLDASEPKLLLPDRLISRGRLFSSMIPFLLVCEQAEPGGASFSELEKLLRTFLAEEVLLIPLKEQEWLILGPASLINDAQSGERDEETEESLEESLSSIAFGLHEMLESEWMGECHLAVSHPISPANSIVGTTALLRETVHLGRAFHIGSNIHLPWLLHLERLLNTIPEVHRIKFVEQALKRTDAFLDPEILTTLETFFALDCNVSETAKKLYIHRNTLLYRLDKLKQETELDVRQFRDAVLVKIILLLYKVTKRA
ncbi:PucR family transcriptional regulator [Paenibacillus sacheonensis]|uniref:PucR family transcriptional regulator n=1 Tax=Paenibacillus sacheonensis TaxID=742054 RepID=A0A7X5C251_9BACL|nr:helix-turn-helix domain-containing protein [Paenibacillus sacheonensis]MBM7566999.1 carbohydrate diacid regulator [Paenibacillus sacheonensis]NBC73426.1 PucR family transcriptional regulator [Paenibacillus sacheonensis]